MQKSVTSAILLSFLLIVGVRPSAAQTPAPSTYNAYTGTDVKVVPPAPALGPANSVITDPAFGSRILRVTDANTRGGESFISTDSGFSRTWNANSTAIKLTGPAGDGYWLEFNPSTFQAGTGSGDPVLHPVSFGATWEWSAVQPNIIYYLSGSTIETWNTTTGASTPLAGTPTGEPVTYMAAVIGLDNWVCAAAGAGSQDTYTKIFCVNPSNPSIWKFIDVANKTINGAAQSSPYWPTSAAGQTIGIHDISGGTGRNWVEVTFHQQSWGGNGGAVFDLSTNTWSLVTGTDPYWSGHVSMGNGKYANSSGSINGDDSRGLVLRDPDNLMNSSEYLFVTQPFAPWNSWCDADHSSWLNSLTNPNAPILDSRYSAGTGCPFAWSDEITAAAVDGSNTVWRFAHNFNGGSQCYYAQAFAQISNDGNWALFSSYWGGTLGPDTSFGCTTRIDTFIVDLKDATGPASPSSAGSSSSSTTTTSTSSSGSTSTSTAGSSPAAVTTTTTQSSSPAITYSQGWYTVPNTAFSGGSAVEAMNAGSTATFTFTGVAVRWIGYEDQWSGMATVTLDGQQQATVDTYAPSAQAQTVVWGAGGLSNTTHTITITVSGAMDSSSAGEWVWLNAFAVDIPVAVPTAPVTPSVPAGQTISFAPLSNVVLGVAPVTLVATASSELPVSFASATAAVCSISGTAANIVGTGTCSITASQTGSASYSAAAPVTQSFTVTAAGVVPTSAGPAIAPGGVSPIFSSSTTIQPGSWVSIYGTNLASATAQWTGNYPILLGGTSVTINGKSAYLSYVSPTQLNLQAPDDTATGIVNVTVTNAAGSATSMVTLGQFSPSFLLLDGNHVAGIIIRSDGSGAYGGGTYDIVGPTGTSFGYPTVAAKAGDSVEIFGVGFGPTNPAVPAGRPFSGAATAANPVELAIASATANPLFAGMSMAGIYQINVTIPAGLGTGDQPLAGIAGDSRTQASAVISLQ